MTTALHRTMVGTFYGLVRARILAPRLAYETAGGIAQLKRALDILSVNCVIDVGANAGQFARRLRRMGYSGRIVSFEPHPVAFRDLDAASARDPLWQRHQCAIGERTEMKPFQFSDFSSYSSFLIPKHEMVRVPTRTEDVQVRTLDSLFDSIIDGIATPRVLLKMDTQGWDVAVVKGATNCIGRVSGLLSEVSALPLYEGMTPYYEALPFYHSLGFDLFDVTPVNHAPDGRLIEFDCLLIRSAHGSSVF